MSGINTITMAAATIYFFTLCPLIVGLMIANLAIFVAKSFSIVDKKLAGKYIVYDTTKTIISLTVRFIIFISSDGTLKSTVKQTPITNGLKAKSTNNAVSVLDENTGNNTVTVPIFVKEAGETQACAIKSFKSSQTLKQDEYRKSISINNCTGSNNATGSEDSESIASDISDITSYVIESDGHEKSDTSSVFGEYFSTEFCIVSASAVPAKHYDTNRTFELLPTISCEENFRDAEEQFCLRSEDYLDDISEAWRVWDRVNRLQLARCSWALLDKPDVFYKNNGPTLVLTTPDGNVKYPQDMKVYSGDNAWADMDDEEDF